MPSTIDHLLALTLVGGLPAYAAVTYRTFLRKVRTDPRVRVREYWATLRM